MAIYSNKHNKKFITTTALQKIGVVFICVFSVLLLNLVFNLISFINSFLLGFFGLFSYPILIAGVVFGILFCMKKRITLTLRDVLYFTAWLVTFVCLINVITTKEFLELSYGEYLGKVYNYKYSAGGLLFSIFTYPVNYLTHYVGSIVFFAIALTVFTAMIIERAYAYNSLKKLANSKISSAVIDDNMLEEDDEEYYSPQERVQKTASTVDDSIFIADEDEPEDVEEVQAREKDRNKARKILGLDKDEPEIEEEIPTNTLPNDFSAARQMGMSKGNYIKTPYNPYNNEKPATYSNVAEGKPNFFFHNDDELENDFTPSRQSNVTPFEKPKEKKSSYDKNREFLRATKGEYKPLEQKDDEVDIYDESFTFDDFNSNKSSYVSKNNKFDNAVREFEETKSFVSEDDDFTIADVEEVDYSAYTQKKKTPYTAEVNTNVAKPQHYLQVGINEIQKKSKPQKPTRLPKKAKYIKPPVDLLKEYINNNENDEYELQQKGRMLEMTLESFKIPAKVSSYTKGPAFTRFELQMPVGIPVSRVMKYVDDIAMSLETRGKIRMEIPIPGKNAFGVEVPNKSVSTVGLRDIIESKNFQQSKGNLTFALGKDISGECRVSNLEDAPHLLVAGATKSGKSVCLNAMLISWLYKCSPEDLRIILIDPKQVEFTQYNDIPHLLIPKVITSTEKALCAFTWAIDEMERRYTIFSQFKVKKIEEYNETDEVVNRLNPKLPYIVIVVDELSDLMSQCKKEIEEKIIRLTQKSRAAGIHLVLATQRPSVDVITGVIKSNLPSRIAFAVASLGDSKTILDGSGAENLLGKGDMLYAPIDLPEPSRIQGSFVSNNEINDILDFVKENNEADFDEEIEEKMFNRNANGGFEVEPNAEVFDPLMVDALRNIIRSNNVSTSKLQRIFSIGFTRAGRIVDQMEAAGFISPKDSKNNRVIYITQQEFEEKFGEDL